MRIIQNYVTTVQVQVWHYISVCLFRKSKEATTNTRWQTTFLSHNVVHHQYSPTHTWEWLITPRVRAVRIPLLCWWWRVKSSRYPRLVEALRRSSCIAIGSSSQTSVLALRGMGWLLPSDVMPRSERTSMPNCPDDCPCGLHQSNQVVQHHLLMSLHPPPPPLLLVKETWLMTFPSSSLAFPGNLVHKPKNHHRRLVIPVLGYNPTSSSRIYLQVIQSLRHLNLLKKVTVTFKRLTIHHIVLALPQAIVKWEEHHLIVSNSMALDKCW